MGSQGVGNVLKRKEKDSPPLSALLVPFAASYSVWLVPTSRLQPVEGVLVWLVTLAAILPVHTVDEMVLSPPHEKRPFNPTDLPERVL